MYTANFLVWLLFFYLNLEKGQSHDSSPGAIANVMCKIYTDNAKKNNICPLSNFNPSISRAVFAESGEFPHMVELGYKIDDNTEWVCSGSIISKNYVLTAAHCTLSIQREVNVTQLRVRAGVTDQKDLSNAQIRNIESIKLYSKLEIPVKYNNIALIKVKEDFIFNKFVGPVCLYTNEENPDGKGLQTGWSPIASFISQPAQILKFFVNFISNEICTNTYNRYTLHLPNGIPKESMVCVGGNPNIDYCQILLSKKLNARSIN
ncbi:CLIP domain-containing serine protease C9-like isoform X2 [Diabrotica undecimpunctata]|uniref:CLIP domain-containing serine protease C9-like isoform X2 n=1 Tax=Diabrotica undecimpunctata TaxID=50387 RepID=UPI003B63DF90